MDPVSQAAIGASFSQSITKNTNIQIATFLGCVAGMAPDLDVLISSKTDPLLFLEFHRQFTHSLFFIPIGSLIVAAFFYPIFKRYCSFKAGYLYCFLGYASHGLLDACTTYGTQLFWPLSSSRHAWNNISIIDPFFTFPILIFIALSVYKNSRLLSKMGLIWAIGYLLLGLVQRDRAVSVGQELAASRGHTIERLEAKPGFANLLVWKTIYESEGHFYVDAARVGFKRKVIPGGSIKKLDTSTQLSWLDLQSQQALDVERFKWFSNDYLAVDQLNPYRVIDIRYSAVANEIDPLWAIDLDPDKEFTEHVKWVALRQIGPDQINNWWSMIRGTKK
ncbi:MAG: metal-dependent hydrolase [Gammaproteobacteria bacterium]|nr:metal-dependent hydrolase [Gammaproteobacteria bacterium]